MLYPHCVFFTRAGGITERRHSFVGPRLSGQLGPTTRTRPSLEEEAAFERWQAVVVRVPRAVLGIPETTVSHGIDEGMSVTSGVFRMISPHLQSRHLASKQGVFGPYPYVVAVLEVVTRSLHAPWPAARACAMTHDDGRDDEPVMSMTSRASKSPSGSGDDGRPECPFWLMYSGRFLTDRQGQAKARGRQNLPSVPARHTDACSTKWSRD